MTTQRLAGNGWTVLSDGPRSAPTMVLVHGWGAAADSWAPHLPFLAGSHRVLTPDLPGHGATPAVPVADIPGLAAGIAELIETDAVAPAVLVGHSMGAQPCVRVAVDRPDLVTAVVTVDPAYGAADDEMAAAPDVLADLRLRGAAAGAEFVDRAFAEHADTPLRDEIRAQMLATDGATLAQLFESMYLAEHSIGARAPAKDTLARLRAPMLSLYSSHAAAAWCRSLSLPPRSEVWVWPDATHYLHQEHPEAFCSLLRTWSTLALLSSSPVPATKGPAR